MAAPHQHTVNIAACKQIMVPSSSWSLPDSPSGLQPAKCASAASLASVASSSSPDREQERDSESEPLSEDRRNLPLAGRWQQSKRPTATPMPTDKTMATTANPRLSEKPPSSTRGVSNKNLQSLTGTWPATKLPEKMPTSFRAWRSLTRTDPSGRWSKRSPKDSFRAPKSTLGLKSSSARFSTRTATAPPGCGFAHICQPMRCTGSSPGYSAETAMHRGGDPASPDAPKSAHVPPLKEKRCCPGGTMPHAARRNAGPMPPSASKHCTSPKWSCTSAPSGRTASVCAGLPSPQALKATGLPTPTSTQSPLPETMRAVPGRPSASKRQPRCAASEALQGAATT
mmetsp:Transcript_77960/g.218523  ORF Transcript_77960/g.218523 Transcript_77960/m.218523 type:complete len:341 (+) Transcript_77960:1055-2077(+)